MQAITFIEGLFSREYGIRTLYFALLMIPGLSLLWLYRMALIDNDNIRSELVTYKTLLIECIDEKENLKETTRKEVMTELEGTLSLINNFKAVISEDNEKLKKEADNVSKKLNNVK